MWAGALDLLFAEMKKDGVALEQIVAVSGSGQQHGSVYLNERAAGVLANLNPQKTLVENLRSEPTTPEHLMEILVAGHLDRIGVCLDLGHAHITASVAEAIATLGSRIVQVHAHDNNGQKDEHLFPGQGTIDWPATTAALNALTTPPAMVLELTSKLPNPLASYSEQIRESFAQLG